LKPDGNGEGEVKIPESLKVRILSKEETLSIPSEDYQVLAQKYPNHKKDMWGDLGLLIGRYEFHCNSEKSVVNDC
jgi:hypothetical protein